MSASHTALVISRYPSSDAAETDLKGIRRLHNDKIIGYLDSAIVSKDAAGEISLHREGHLIHDLGKQQLRELAADYPASSVTLVVEVERKHVDTVKEYVPGASSTEVVVVEGDDTSFADIDTEPTRAEWMQGVQGGHGFEDGSVGHLGV